MAQEVPEGAAVLPQIPEELGIHPLLLAVLHAVVFLAGSEAKIVHLAASHEAIEHIAEYLQRVGGKELERVRADLAKLHAFAVEHDWPKEEVQFFETFLDDFGMREKEA
jgi:hypothetical protein